MANFYLVQHGKAKSKDEDPERPLTIVGKRESERIAELAARLDLDIGEIWHSGKTRAKETAVIFGEALHLSDSVKMVDGLHPTDDVKPIAERLARESEAVMIVGHLPFMPRLVGQMVDDDPEAELVEFRNSGIVALVSTVAAWTPHWQLNPA